MSRTPASFSRVVTAFGYLGPYSVANRVAAPRACSRLSAYITSCSAALTRGWSRFGSLSIQLPERLKMVHVIRTDDSSGIEDYWHRRFEAKHKNGEWFELDAGDIAAFKRRKFM